MTIRYDLSKIEAFRQHLRQTQDVTEGDIQETVAMFLSMPECAGMFAPDVDPEADA